MLRRNRVASLQAPQEGGGVEPTADAQKERAAPAPQRKLAAAGGTVNIGFVGSYSGPNVAPSAFTLNGTQCTSA